jgi:hypothetical protein
MVEIEPVLPKGYIFAPFINIRPSAERKAWYLGRSKGAEWQNEGGILGEFKVRITPYDKSIRNLIDFLFDFTGCLGIGAKTQTGFGIAKRIDKKSYNVEDVLSWLKNSILPTGASNAKDLPSLRKMFFCRINIQNIDSLKDVFDGKVFRKESKSEIKINFKEYQDLINPNYRTFFPTAPLVRFGLRSLFEDAALRHFLFGFLPIRGEPSPIHRDCLGHVVKDRKNAAKWYCQECRKGELSKSSVWPKLGSKIYVSHIFQAGQSYQMRIWGCIPDKLPKNIKREDVLLQIHKRIFDINFWKAVFNDPFVSENNEFKDRIEWREFNSDRDTLKKEDMSDFISSLMGSYDLV